MDLWIRSQSRKDFMKAERVGISLGGTSILVNGIVYGQYETEERAIEVLDDIQGFMLINYNFNGSYEEGDLYIKNKILGHMCRLYDMPEK